MRSKWTAGGWGLIATSFAVCVTIVPATAQESSTETPTVAELLSQAEAERNELKWDEAITLLRQAVDRAAEDRASAAMAQARIGRYLMKSGRLNEAEVELAAVANWFPDQIDAVYQAAVWQTDILQSRGDMIGVENAALNLFNDAAGSPHWQAWAKVKLAEVPIANQREYDAIPQLEQIITEAKDVAPEPANWARVRLLQVLTDKVRWPEAIALGDEMVAEHAAGRASDEQAAFGLLWKSRALERSRLLNEAIAPAEMAVALASPSYPEIAADAEDHLARIYQRQGSMLKEGWGPLMVEAMRHYGLALGIAESAGLPESRVDMLRFQYASRMRDLGMREKALAWLRRGIEDPAQMSKTDFRLAEQISLFLGDLPEAKRAWISYLADPVNRTDPTAIHVIAEFGQSPTPASSETLNAYFRRDYWLGQLAFSEERYGVAATVLTAAVEQAESPGEKAKAYALLSKVARKIGNRREVKRFVRLAAESWREEVLTAKHPTAAHKAAQQMIAVYERHGFVDDMLVALREVVAELDMEVQPSQSCFARLCLGQKYIEYDRLVEGEQVLSETLYYYLDRPFDYAHADLCVKVARTLSTVLAMLENPQAARQVRDDVYERWPERFDEHQASPEETP